MITKLNHKFLILVNEFASQTESDWRVSKGEIIQEISRQLGYANTNRMTGVYNGSYEMSLTEAVIICHFFQLKSIDDLISLETSSPLITAHQIIKEKAA